MLHLDSYKLVASQALKVTKPIPIIKINEASLSMATPKQPASLVLVLALATLSTIFNNPTNAADCVGSGTISVYWGQKSDDEGTLQEACDTGNYNILILESLIVYDNGTTPTLNLASHCGGSASPCSQLQSQIEHCQQNGIKVFLSLGQDRTTLTRPNSKTVPSLSSEDTAKELASYLLENYLSGNPGPLGSVTLDGIDIADVTDTEKLAWDEVVKAISGSTTDRKIYLSGSPQCVYPDYYLGKAIDTGLFDYLWVEFFYQNPSCIYSNGNASNLLAAWKKWTSNVPNSLIFLGLVASDEVEGYIEPEVLKSQVLPDVKKINSNYGGVMIWDRSFDKKSNYSAQIKDSVGKVCRCVCDDESNFYGLRSPFMAM
ncbi:hypothetical protein RJT34_00154 [Clitoria ternatea]|uniref:GH18 domain-containing protein n=1 Tax=Clitoria ternatea TaxID=43366 RepID=A0AAN9KHW5_CLITE